MALSGLDKCANPDCRTKFHRMGTGKIYTVPVKQPQAWGLPPHVKQKVVWLCSKCAITKEVRFDNTHHEVLVVRRHQAERQTA